MDPLSENYENMLFMSDYNVGSNEATMLFLSSIQHEQFNQRLYPLQKPGECVMYRFSFDQ